MDIVQVQDRDMDAENREKIVIQKLNTYVQIVIRYRKRDKEAENYSDSLQLRKYTDGEM